MAGRCAGFHKYAETAFFICGNTWCQLQRSLWQMNLHGGKKKQQPPSSTSELAGRDWTCFPVPVAIVTGKGHMYTGNSMWSHMTGETFFCAEFTNIEVLLRWLFDLWRNTILHLNFQSSFDNIPLLGPYKKDCLMFRTKLYNRESASYLNPKDLQYSSLRKPLTSPYRHHFFQSWTGQGSQE